MQRADFESGRAELERAIPDLTHDPVEATRAMVFLGHPYGSTWHVSKHIDWLRKAAEMQPDSMSDIDKMTLTVDRMTTLLLLGAESGWDLAARMPVVATTVKEGLQATRGHGNAGYTSPSRPPSSSRPTARSSSRSRPRSSSPTTARCISPPSSFCAAEQSS